jgi:hypothetical protein
MIQIKKLTALLLWEPKGCKYKNNKDIREFQNLPLTLLLWRRTKDEAIKKGFLEVPYRHENAPEAKPRTYL